MGGLGLGPGDGGGVGGGVIGGAPKLNEKAEWVLRGSERF
jgi:hypothetical protein